jgi:hypothetical protein
VEGADKHAAWMASHSPVSLAANTEPFVAVEE